MPETKILLTESQNRNKDSNKRKFIGRSTPARILAIGFLLLILLGGLLLCLPIASENGTGTPLIDSLFTSTSAVCVTGLVVVDTADNYSSFGEIIILFLIQIGGLGFMTFATLFAIILGRKINLRERILLQESLNQLSLEGIVRLIKNVLLLSFSIEGFGALILFLRWFQEMGWQKALYYAIFHSVSSFNNSGFDLFGGFRSLTSFSGDAVVNFTIMGLIILGGLGFYVLSEIYTKKGRNLSLHSRLVIRSTVLLILIGAILIFLLEMNNPGTLGNADYYTKIIASLFQSVSPRTAGFNTLSIGDLKPATLLLIIILMFIGASPGSTGGGIKTTTFVSIILCVISVLKGRENVVAQGRTLPNSIIRKSFALIALAIFWVSLVVFILLITEHATFMQIIFETVSAFATVGLSTGITASLSMMGKIALILTMFFGRVGLITVMLAIGLQSNKAEALSHVKYPEERIMIG